MCIERILPLFLAVFFGLAAPQNLSAQCNPSAAEIPKNGFDEDCDGLDDIFLTLPPYIYAIEGQDLEIYFRNLILSKHPQDYQFSVNTPLAGNSNAEKWMFLPAETSAGEFPLSISVKSWGGQTLATASTTVRISPNEAPTDMTPKKLLLFGHSFFDQGYMPKYIYDLLKKPGNPPVSFHGKKVSWANDQARHEGYGGMMARWFFNDGGSPIKYGNKINFRQYFNEVMCQNCAPDWVVFHLDINDFCGYTALAGNTLQEIDDSITNDWNRHATRLIDSIRATAPNAKIAVCISPPPNARESSFSQTYGGNPILSNRWRWQKIINRLIFKNIERYSNRENQNIYLIPEYLDIDDLGEYNPPDARHPDPPDNNINTHCGYNEIAKTIYAWLRWVEFHPNSNGGGGTLVNAYRDADGDGFGKTDDVVLANPIPAGRVATPGDCDDQNAARHPGATEICNDLDDNCNAVADEENVPPVAKCKPNFSINLDGNGHADLQNWQINDGSWDACNLIILEIDKSSFDCSAAGQTQNVKLTVRDAFQNSATCQTAVQILENAAPIAKCKPNFSIGLDAGGHAEIQNFQINDGSWDACGALNFQISKDKFSCADVGKNLVTLTVSDVSGNKALCSTEVFVVDNTPPIASCHPSVQITLDADGHAEIHDWQVNNGSWDACPGNFFQLNRDKFSCADAGQNVVTLTVSDNSGNTATCTTQVFVKDLTPPTAVCQQNISLFLDTDGEADLMPAMVDFGSSDGCSILNLEVFPNHFDCSKTGSQTVKLTATDASGNKNACFSNVFVKDNQPPSLSFPLFQDVDITLGTAGSKAIFWKDIFSGNDNCGSFNWQFSTDDGQNFTTGNHFDFSCSDLAAAKPLVFWVKILDKNGNESASRQLNFWVEDNAPPVLICKEIFVNIETDGETDLTISDLLFGATDECSSVNFPPGQTLKINCSQAGFTLFKEISGKDAAGNLGSCTAKIHVNLPGDADFDGVSDCDDECPVNPQTTTFFNFFKDYDGDGFGAGAVFKTCENQSAMSKNNLDCDDQNASVFPSATEILNDLDDDCDGKIDEGLVSSQAPKIGFPKILLAPNPTTGLLFVDWTGATEIFSEKISIFTVAGQGVCENPTAQQSSGKLKVDVSNLPAGAYFLKIKFQNGSTAVRLFEKI